MTRFFGIIVGVVVSIIIVLVIVDIISTPVAVDSSCLLDTDIILPDKCVARCDAIFGCPAATTRPYLFIGQQAASCPLACIRID